MKNLMIQCGIRSWFDTRSRVQAFVSLDINQNSIRLFMYGYKTTYKGRCQGTRYAY